MGRHLLIQAHLTMNLLNVALLLICAVSTAHCETANCEDSGSHGGSCAQTCVYEKPPSSGNVAVDCGAKPGEIEIGIISPKPDDATGITVCYVEPGASTTATYTISAKFPDPPLCKDKTASTGSTGDGKGKGKGKGKGDGAGGGAAALMIYAISVAIP